MKKFGLWLTAVAVLLVGGAFAFGLAQTKGERPDCPGKIICPVNGEEICKDRCPLTETKDSGPAKVEESAGCCGACR